MKILLARLKVLKLQFDIHNDSSFVSLAKSLMHKFGKFSANGIDDEIKQFTGLNARSWSEVRHCLSLNMLKIKRAFSN